MIGALAESMLSMQRRVVEDAKRLNDIATAIKEEQANQAAAQQDAKTREHAEVGSQLLSTPTPSPQS